MPTLAAVIFDSSALLVPQPTTLAGIRTLLGTLRKEGLRSVVFTSKARDVLGDLVRLDLPPVDLALFEHDVGEPKGSPVWIARTAEILGVSPQQLLYVGDQRRDWLMAALAGVVYLHAGWKNETSQSEHSLVAHSPGSVWRFVSHFLRTPPRFEYWLDLPEHGLHIRCLLNSSAELPASRPETFPLDSLWTDGEPIQVRNTNAWDLLTLHAVTSLYVEGLITAGTILCLYPGHKPGELPPDVPVARKLVHAYHPDLLIRAAKACDTSEERRCGRTDNAGFTNQAHTVHLNSELADTVRGRSVVVFDDFMLSGRSGEWARHLLVAAGAQRVILLTLGKVAKLFANHEIVTMRVPDTLTPLRLRRYPATEFSARNVALEHRPGNRDLMHRLIECWRKGKPYCATATSEAGNGSREPE